MVSLPVPHTGCRLKIQQAGKRVFVGFSVCAYSKRPHVDWLECCC